MRKSSVCFVALALLLFATTALAQAGGGSTRTTGTTGQSTGTTGKRTTGTAAMAEPAGAKCKPRVGSVASKDDAAKSFMVHTRKSGDTTFMTNDKTTYRSKGKPATWADLAAGENVAVTCTMDGTNMVAKSVKIGAAPKTKTATGKGGKKTGP